MRRNAKNRHTHTHFYRLIPMVYLGKSIRNQCGWLSGVCRLWDVQSQRNNNERKEESATSYINIRLNLLSN